MLINKRRLTLGLAGVLIVVVGVMALRPDPVVVDTAPVVRGLLRVTIDEEGRTRIRNRYVVTAPAAGRIERLSIKEGDGVEAGTALTYLYPVPLSASEQQAAQARVEAAKAHLREVEAQAARLSVEGEDARRAYERARRLLDSGGISREMYENAEVAHQASRRMLEAAQFSVEAAAADVRSAQSVLLAMAHNPAPGSGRIPITAPVAGRVLRVYEENARVVMAGTPIVEVGDPGDLEVVIDVLSEDAVRIRPGAAVLVDAWGGEMPLNGRVRVVGPSAFTKVSALGVEEQRVNVVADLIDPPAALGDGYRVEGRIVVWESDGVLTVPTGALFRHQDGWAVFVAEGGRAKRRPVETGHRGALEVEILSGLREQETVLLHPPNDLEDGAPVKPRHEDGR